MNPNKALWEKGDFTRIAEVCAIAARRWSRLGIDQGRMLDLGCGDGTTALPAARSVPMCLASTLPSNLVAAGNRRASRGFGNSVSRKATPRISAT